jgi:transmembrane sensor
MEKRINKTDLLKFLNGNCSLKESMMMNQFLKTAYGQALLNELLSDRWSNSKDIDINQEKLSLWKQEWSLKFAAETNQAEIKTRRFKFSTFFRYAAVLAAIVLGIGIYSISVRRNDTALLDSKLIVKTNPLGQHSSFSLSDGTKIYLGPGSSFSYPTKFSKNTREVLLHGEAYFEVYKNKEKPFIIFTGNIRTQVLGTTFKISSFKDNPILVSVTSGKVSVTRTKGNKIEKLAYLLPGEQLTCNQNSTVFKSTFNIEDIQNWKQGQLVFNGTPLSELVKEISRWYNVTINIRSENLKNIPITVTIDGNMPVNKFLDVLSSSFGFNYVIIDRTISIY